MSKNTNVHRKLSSAYQLFDARRYGTNNRKCFFVERFFNLSDDDVSKAEVIQQIDNNIGQQMKTDAKFYTIHVSPSENGCVLEKLKMQELELKTTKNPLINEIAPNEMPQNQKVTG